MSDRRAARRASGGRVREIAGRVRAGQDLCVLDLSPSGALVEGGRPLRPGARIDVQLSCGGDRVNVPARVVRCLVAAIDADEGVRYHAGLAFEQRLVWLGEDPTPAASALPGGANGGTTGACSEYPEPCDGSIEMRGARENT